MDAPDEEAAKILRDVLAWLDKKYEQADPKDKRSWLERRARVVTGDSVARQDELTAMLDEQHEESQ